MKNPLPLMFELPGRVARGVRDARRTGDVRAVDAARLELLEFKHRTKPVRSPVSVGGMRLHFTDYPVFREVFKEVFLDRPYDVALPTRQPVIFDCGANIGMASLFFRRRYPNARVSAFEPDPAAFKALERNIVDNAPGIEAHQVALSDTDGYADFHHIPDTPGSLLGSLSATVTAEHSRARLTATETVQVRRLSPFIDGPVDLVKIDVEGAEGAILTDLAHSGAIGHVAAMLIEYHHRLPGVTPLADLLELLTDSGFDFQLTSPNETVVLQRGRFQDLLIYAYRP